VAGIIIAVSRGTQLPGGAELSALLSANFAVLMGALIINNLAMLGVTGWLVQRRLGSPFAAYFPAVPMMPVVLAAGTGVVLSLLINCGNQLIDNAGWLHFTDTPAERAMVPHGAAQFVVAVIVVALLAPLAEEFIFRGLLLRWLLPFAKTAGAVLISGTVFGVIHGQFFMHPGAQGWFMTVELIATGIVLGIWAVQSGSLRTSFAVHAAFNLTATILSVLLP
jgi:membrane protease YdiL (CAAX protease family)